MWKWNTADFLKWYEQATIKSALYNSSFKGYPHIEFTMKYEIYVFSDRICENIWFITHTCPCCTKYRIKCVGSIFINPHEPSMLWDPAEESWFSLCTCVHMGEVPARWLTIKVSFNLSWFIGLSNSEQLGCTCSSIILNSLRF